MVVGGCLAWWQGVVACCCYRAAVVVGAVGWGGRSLSLCWLCCHVHLVVGLLPFSCSSAHCCCWVAVACGHLLNKDDEQ